MWHVKDTTRELVCCEYEEFMSIGWVREARCVHGGDCGKGRALGEALK
jgi:hypothetical protein